MPINRRMDKDVVYILTYIWGLCVCVYIHTHTYIYIHTYTRTYNVQDVQVGFRKGRRTRDQTANIHWIREKARNSRKTSISALLIMLKL